MKSVKVMILAVFVVILIPNAGFGACLLLNLGPEQLVQAGDPCEDIVGSGSSIPTYADWNNDGKKDLIVGEGSRDFFGGAGKVRVYLNVGTASVPQFSDYFYAQSNGSDLTVPATAGCLGAFPRVVYWNAGDLRKDLLVGLGDGTVKIFLNVGTDSDPNFDAGTNVQVGRPGLDEQDLDVGALATPTLVDWDADGVKDLVIGAADGLIHIFHNCSCAASTPSFYTSPPAGFPAKENDANLIVPTLRSSPEVLDVDRDGKNDLLTANTEGQLLFYKNTGSIVEPNFSGYVLIESNGVPIDISGFVPKAKPFVCDWTGDGYLDVLIGVGNASDQKVRLYQGVPIAGDFEPDCDVDFYDYAVLALTWGCEPGDDLWNPDCDISILSDSYIDWHDVDVFTDNWLVGIE